MIPQRLNTAMPPVVAPPIVNDARRITSPHGVTDDKAPTETDVADSNVPNPDTSFKKALSPRAITSAASLVLLVCVASLTLQHQLGPPTPTPDSGVDHHPALLSVAGTLSSNHTTTTQLDHQHSQPALASGNEVTEASPTAPESLEPENQIATLAVSRSGPQQAVKPDVVTADAHKEVAGKVAHTIANDVNPSPSPQDIANTNQNISPGQVLTENANLLVSTASSDTSFTDWQPQDWMASVIAVKPEMPSEQQPNQIVCKPDSLAPPKNASALTNGQCESPDPNYETKIGWVDQPEVAFERAKSEDKLVFMIHISGNFKIPGFT
ncbi:hypothetical protein OAF83_02855 [Rubripirellula sp.]|nr:hypothetical protein [Rubripirellula sp.]MDB4749826.1 hypothetical protein [Rubripirellula sp.]